ncbi:HsdM family class I SAM-dependent methyltransferase [Caviibacterium pharyngocola]|uniref:HsdM family class I SAM-dependent methyltransferase n=1 Tax=Caviibacterium pharyngocola TaxID=28159 RepID=UPI001A9C2BF5|nr:N-6 DNA methylase [Caviibacterium pharyngocola]
MIETKQQFVKNDEDQLREYLNEEKALHHSKKVICILANTKNDQIKVWKSFIDDDHFLENEKVIDTFEHYKSLFVENKQNNREKVLKNTYDLNELLHKKDIDEKLRSQFVGTTLLYIKDTINKQGYDLIDEDTCKKLKQFWSNLSEKQIRAGIEDTLSGLLNGSENKTKKIELIQQNVLANQKIKRLTTTDWVKILDTITKNIYAYIDTQSSEGQDILNLFFIAFNKYTGKADKNQAFTPDHITEFMCRITDINRNKRVFDGTCGSGAFLVQALVKKLSDCHAMQTTNEQKLSWAETVKREHIWGIEIEENAYGLATTNMLIHGDGNSNIKLGNLFENKTFIEKANPDVILMNPPYNAKPISIPSIYKSSWTKAAKEGKEDPTKGMVFIQFISDCIKEMNEQRLANGEEIKEVKLAVLLPVAVAIGTSNILTEAKHKILIDNTLEAVFSLPNEIFYPGASASACCMVFTLGKPHKNTDGTINQTFFGYYKEDGFKKKKNLGRIEQFDEENNSLWKKIENDWIAMYRNKTIVDGLSAMAVVTGNDEWLCEAYMKTDYSKLTKNDFQQTINSYLAYQIKIGKIYES